MRHIPCLPPVTRTTRPRAVAAAMPRHDFTLLVRWAGIALVALGLVFAALDAAHAKRVGGGKSFGSRDTYSRPYDKPVAPDRTVTNPSQQSAPGQGGPQTATPPRPGAFGGLGGMFGGLLMGGLIGSMLFGGGMGGGFGILELLLVGGGIYLLLRLLRSRGAARQTTGAAGGERFAYVGPQGGAAGQPEAGRRFDGWATLNDTPAGPSRGTAPGAPVMPEGMDEAEFLSGAKALFARLQASWDRRDLEDIRRFATPEVFAEIQGQAASDPSPGRTDVLMVEARVLEAGEMDGRTVITVLFDALLREDAKADAPSQVREVWRISRDNRAARPEWTLEGIQQLEI